MVTLLAPTDQQIMQQLQGKVRPRTARPPGAALQRINLPPGHCPCFEG
jgi:hypothetical protein